MIIIVVREAKKPIGRVDTERRARIMRTHVEIPTVFVTVGQRDNFRLLLLLRLLLVFRAGRLRSGTPKNRGKNCIRKGIVTQCHTRPHVHAHKRTLALALALALTGSTRERESEKE